MTSERAFALEVRGDELVAVLHEPGSEARIGVVIIVGGPQYRVGSHRQFVDLARRLAAGGVPVLRFDVRGMGDSSGQPRTFEDIGDDIRAAVDALCIKCPSLESICLWGLCDGASAALLYCLTDARIDHLVLANPWVHTESTRSQALIRTYYWQRLIDPGFWRSLLRGDVAVGRSVREAGRAAVQTAINARNARDDFLERMLVARARFRGRSLIILSGRDMVADEYRGWLASRAEANAAFASGDARCVELADANHTFSSHHWRIEVAALTLRWLLDGSA